MNESIKRLVDEAMVDFRSKFHSVVEEKFTDQANISKLQILSEGAWSVR